MKDSFRSYEGHPSCTTCKVDYLGEGTCGACLFVVSLLADSVIVLERQAKLREALESISRWYVAAYDVSGAAQDLRRVKGIADSALAATKQTADRGK